MNKKGFELAISTIILFILGLLVLIALIYAVTGGFKNFNATTKPLTDSIQAQSLIEACNIACKGQDKLVFCCKNQSLSGVNYKCSDPQLGINCDLKCTKFEC